MRRVMHLGLTKEQIGQATIALIPGDPDRVNVLSEQFSKAKMLTQHREFRSALCETDGVQVVLCSTGIGGPSTSICVEELAELGIKNFIRVGTCGTIQDGIKLGDLIVTNAAVRLDGASYHFAPAPYPAVSNFKLTRRLVDACEQAGHAYHVGITASSDTFYPGQERYDTFSGYVHRELKGSLEEWRALRVLNYEMESATLFTMASALGLRAGCIAGVVAHRLQSEAIQANALEATELATASVAVSAALTFAREHHVGL